MSIESLKKNAYKKGYIKKETKPTKKELTVIQTIENEEQRKRELIGSIENLKKAETNVDCLIKIGMSEIFEIFDEYISSLSEIKWKVKKPLFEKRYVFYQINENIEIQCESFLENTEAHLVIKDDCQVYYIQTHTNFYKKLAKHYILSLKINELEKINKNRNRIEKALKSNTFQRKKWFKFGRKND